MNIKHTHKIAVIFIWTVSILLSITNLVLFKFATRTLICTGMMGMISIFSTVLYFASISDRTKAILITTMTSLFTLIISIVVGGNSQSFLLSFVALALTALYFDNVVLAVTNGIYVSACIIAYFVNPYYITGSEIETYLAPFMIVFYTTATIILYYLTHTVNGIIKQVKDTIQTEARQQELIQKNAEATTMIAKSLNESITTNSNDLHLLAEEAIQVNEATSQISDVIAETTSSIGLLNQKVTSSRDQIDLTYEITNNLKENYKTVIENVEHGANETKHLSLSMDEISSAIETAHHSTKSLLIQANDISGILGEINQIANQTNLLALNASIEAARAGEQGRGFAVVAEQIRVLSEESKNASMNISNILDSLSKMIEDVSDKVTNGFDSVQEGRSNLNTLVNRLNDIEQATITSEKSISEEYTIIHTMKSEFKEMVDEFHNIFAMVEENTAMLATVSESISNQTESLHHVSENLLELNSLSHSLDEQASQV